ncbi:MAG: inorganic diphosphatase [Candidatus Aenigmatarchaeota archaeon]
MVNYWKELPTGPNPPEEIFIVVEIPKGWRNKIEFDKELNVFVLDRVLYSPFHYDWADYGIIPKTFCEDGDPADGFVLMREGTFPGCVIKCRPIGLLKMIDSGEKDDKIIAVPSKDPFFSGIKDISDISSHLLKEISHFFSHYKDLQEKKVEVIGWEGAKEAKEFIKRAKELYKEKFGD